MLINPEPINAKDLRSLIELVETVERLPIERLEVMADEQCAALDAELPEIARRARIMLTQAKVDGDLRVQLVRVAHMTERLTGHVLRPSTDTAYKLSAAWWYAVGSLHNPERSIAEGIFSIDRKRFEEQTPEWEVANRPLFVKKEEFNRFLRPRPTSNAELRREGQAIVAEFQRDHPDEDQMLQKNEFIQMIMRRLPGCIKGQAKWAWGECAPTRWRKGGRRQAIRRESTDKSND